MVYLFTVTCLGSHIFYDNGYIYACDYHLEWDKECIKIIWYDKYSNFIDENINPEVRIEPFDISLFLPEKLILIEHGGPNMFFTNLYNEIQKHIFRNI